ncbi:MAG: phosphoglycerate kinase [Nanoarchaeota archaeon]|jgi:phosphoglycerate kinase|nr:phosphoglycerate kinase [Nanoarchaeota archaeon]
MKTLKDIKFKDKLVLLRSDLNSDVKNGKVILSERIFEAAKTIKALQKKGARVVVVAHQGNPGKKDFLPLKQHNKLLNKFVKIKFIDDVIGEKAINAIGKLKSGEAILLDNVRQIPDEFTPKKKGNVLLKKLAPLFDVYVNDSFSVCHREHTSIVGFPQIIKETCAGLLLEKEVNALKKVSMKNCVYILGGAKPETNIKLLNGKNKILACGLFGQVCIVAKGKDLGYQNKFLKKTTLVKGGYAKFLKELKGKLKHVETPVDFAVGIENKRVEFDLKKFPLNYQIDDIGEKTIKKYVKIIKNAKAIYMKGPAGFSQDKKFAKGTVAILRAITESKGFSLIGGGHLSDAINQYKIPKSKIGHISLSGGALLNYVAGKKLCGLEALK